MTQSFFGHLSIKKWASSFPPFVFELYMIRSIEKKILEWLSNSSAQALKNNGFDTAMF